jgi:hypothetical protein
VNEVDSVCGSNECSHADRGGAYVFRRDGNDWVKTRRLVGSGALLAGELGVAPELALIGGGGPGASVLTNPLSEAELRLEGTAQGGSVTASWSQYPVQVATSSGESAAAVAARLGVALDHLPLLALGGAAAFVDGGRVVVGNASAGDFTFTSNDLGLTAYVVTDCRDGLDDDGDGAIDYPADPGCASASDPSERSPLRPCDDGADNDGDGWVDVGGDPVCQTGDWASEAGRCQDGIDNDGDGGIDFDGGASRHGGVAIAPPDTYCTVAWRDRERKKCGLGFEIAPVVALLAAARGRRRAASGAPAR